MNGCRTGRLLNASETLTLTEQVGLVLVVRIVHFALQLLASLEDVLLHLLPLLLLHLIQGLPAFGILELKGARASKARRFLSLSTDTGITNCIRHQAIGSDA